MTRTRRFRIKRSIIIGIGAALVLFLVATELACRFVLGFGDPPLAIHDDAIEYYLKPSSTYQRFGNTISVNAHSMRSPEISKEKQSSDELRILVIGDSVVYGGHRVDQSEIATSLLPDLLSQRLNRPVTVANIAASSWGPPNMLAFLERFGTFDADIAIVVLSSHDAVDVPLFDPPSEPYWHRSPVCATQDALVSVWDRVFSTRRKRHRERATQITAEARRSQALEATRQLLNLLNGANVETYVARHLERSELAESPHRGHDDFNALATQQAIPLMEWAPAMNAARARGESPYSDNIHPSPTGMALIAQAIADTIVTGYRPPGN